MEIELRSEGLEGIQKFLKRSGIKFKQLSSPEVSKEVIFKPISTEVQQRLTRAPISQQGGYPTFGQKAKNKVYWRPLSENYLRQNPRRLGKPIMVDTGRMKKSFSLNSPENIAEVKKDSNTKKILFLFGSKVPYSKMQNEMRRFIFFHPTLLKKIETNIIKYLLKKNKL